MATLRQREDSLAADWVTFRELLSAGEAERALQLATEVARESSDRFEVMQAFLEQIFVHYAQRRRDGLSSLLNTVEEQLPDASHPRLIATYHILAGAIAYDQGSYGVALLHLAEAERALGQMKEFTQAAVDTWQDLAAIYSQLGYHTRALEASHRCQLLAVEVGLPSGSGIAFLALMHAAVYLDQRGDTTGCVRELTDLVERSRPFVTDLAVRHSEVLRYAVRRLASLDHAVGVDVPGARNVGPFLGEINALGDVCDAIAAGRSGHALALLDGAATPLDVLGVAEPFRLRSLALGKLGDHASALAAERAAFLRANQEERELRQMLAACAGARIDQERLRQSAEYHARAALTDPLTGLPNRRKVDEFNDALIRKGETAALGMLDLNGFKAINDRHGHRTGDIVLQRVSGIFAREVRSTELVARLGGDEFVVVLPDTSKDEAERLGERIEAVIRDEDWSSLISDTPVSVSIGWAELDGDADAALRAADAVLYATKRARQARPSMAVREPTSRSRPIPLE